MPAPLRSAVAVNVRLHISASDLLDATYSQLLSREHEANLILPYALNARSTKKTDLNTFWLSCWTTTTSSSQSITTGPHLDFILSCTNSPLGAYPIFIFANRDAEDLTPAFINPRMTQLVSRLRVCTSPERVFSVFGPTPVTKAFASTWTQTTKFTIERDPFYAASLTYCTPETFNHSIRDNNSLPPRHRLRWADYDDLEQVAALCEGFAEESIYFPLSKEGATREALGLISKSEVWVYDLDDEIACLVAVTRSSANVATITKVYTPPQHRNKGYAALLVSAVCQTLLYTFRKSMVSLYVAHDNPAATKVYSKVGFVGLCGRSKPDDVSDWLELGFKGTKRGHW